LVLALLPFSVSAGLLDKIKETTSKTLDVVKDVKDTVTTGRVIGEEAKRTRDVLIYNDSIQLNRDQVYQLQFALNNRGYDAGAADGQMGQKTRNAIAAYQRDNGFHSDGAVSSHLFNSIVSGISPTYQARVPLSRSEWRQFQSMLNQLGFSAGTPDGKPGPRTRRAVSEFKRSRGLGAAISERDAFIAATSATGVVSGATGQYQAESQSQSDGTFEGHSEPDVSFSGNGALYRQLMSAWIGSEQSRLPSEALAAAYVYAFERHDWKSDYCRSVQVQGNALQASDKLTAMQQRYQQYMENTGFIDLPVTLSYSFSSKAPYVNYDIDNGELVLRGHQWDKRANSADGQAGFAPCGAVLEVPGVAQAQSAAGVPEEFDLDIADYVSTLLAAKAKQEGGDVSYGLGVSDFLTRVKMERNQAALLLDQDRNSARLEVSVKVTLERARPARNGRQQKSPFSAIALQVTAVDANTGILVHDFDLQTPGSTGLPEYLIPAVSPKGSGLPDGLAYFDGAIVTYPQHAGRQMGTTPQTQLALRKLQQKLLLQGAPQLAGNVDAVLYFADLAGSDADQYLSRQTLLSALKSPMVRWQEVPGVDPDEARVTTGWQPTADVFDAERMRRAYVSEIGAGLLDEKIRLPIEFVQLRDISIGSYDIKREGFPLTLTGRNFGAMLPLVQPNLRLAGSYQDVDLNRHVKFLPPFKVMPEIWSVPFDEAESTQDKLTFHNNIMGRDVTDAELAEMKQKNPALARAVTGNRVSRGILATRFLVTGLKYEPPRNGLVGEVRLDTALVSMEVYGDRELTSKIADLPPPAGAILANKGSDWIVDEPKRLEPDTFRLLFLADGNEQQLQGDFWRAAAMERLELERLVSQNSWTAFKLLKPYWGQFFTQSQLASRQPLSEDEVENYRKWTLKRSDFVGRQFLATQIHATKAGATQIATENLGRQLLDRLVSIRSSHGVDKNVEQKLEDTSRATALAEAKKQFPNASEWRGLFNGPDMHVGIALTANAGWYSQVWAGDVPVTRDSSNPITAVVVDDVHAFTAADGKPGVIVKLNFDSLQYLREDGSVIRFTPVGSVEVADNATNATNDTVGESTGITQTVEATPLALLDVVLGEDVQTAVEKISSSYDSSVAVEENTSDDPGLPDSIRIRPSEKVQGAPESVVDLFIDKAQNQVLAVARSLEYGGLGITSAQIKNSLTDRYGDADAVIERPPGSNDNTVYLGWGQTEATAAKLARYRFLSDDCILYPVRNYRKREARISTGELQATCGAYLLAYINERRAIFLLMDTTVVMQRRQVELEKRKLAENEAKKSRAQGIKF
jgi:peptidoglycan hydrolase-like protein with peptidoglycan-binding domain